MEIVIESKSKTILVCQDDNGDIWELTGMCRQCGWCCSFHPTAPPGVPFPNMKTGRCAYVFEAEGGKWVCGAQHAKPFGCVAFPLPGHKTGPNCGYAWQKKEDSL